MVSPDVVASVQAERAKAVQIVEACDVFLRAFAPAAPVVAAYVKPAVKPKPAPRGEAGAEAADRGQCRVGLEGLAVCDRDRGRSAALLAGAASLR
jgi:hypothetical protein